MSPPSSPSRAVTKRSAPSSALTTTPAPAYKRIKRPSTVLPEGEYERGLEHIIQRDFFPGLAETSAQHAYLSALSSGDASWLRSARRTLQAASSPAPPTLSTPHQRSRAASTPRSFAGSTPAARMSGSDASSATPRGSWLRLTAFQQQYTSEDNESFYRQVDSANAARARTHAQLRAGEALPTARTLEEARREAAARGAREAEEAAEGRAVARLRSAAEVADERRAAPDGWARGDARNALMFAPDGVEDALGGEHARAEARSRMGEREIVVANTRLRRVRGEGEAKGAASPTLSAVRDALDGRPRRAPSQVAGGGGETPRVNGWAFVDSEGPEDGGDGDGDGEVELGSADARPNPFSVRPEPARDALHGRVLDRMKRSKLQARGDALDTPASTTPAGESGARAAMSPAAARLLGSVVGGGRSGAAHGSALGDAWGAAAATPRARLTVAGVTPARKR